MSAVDCPNIQNWFPTFVFINKNPIMSINESELGDIVNKP